MRGIRFFIQMLVLLGICLSYGIAQDSTQWYLPEGAIARIGRGKIDDIKYSPDGTLLAVGTSVGVWLYDVRTHAELALLTKGTAAVTAVAFSPHGTMLASASFDGTIHLWDTRTYQLKVTLAEQTFTESLAFSPDGAILASSGREILLWDIDTLKSKPMLSEETHFGQIAFSPDGLTLASDGPGNELRLWDTRTRQLKAVLTDTEESISSIAFSPDGATLAGGDSNNKIHLWDTKTGAHKTTLTGSDNRSAWALAFSPDGATLASANWEMIELWDTKTGTQKTPLTQPGAFFTAFFTNLAFSPDGATLTSCGADGKIRSWDTQTWEHKTTLTHTQRMHAIALSPERATLAIGGDEENWLWDVATRQIKMTLSGHTASIDFLAFSPDGTTLTSKSCEEILLWDAQTGERRGTFLAHTEQPLYSVSNALSPDGTKFALGKSDGTAQLWSFSDERVATLTKHTKWVGGIAFSIDNSVLATGGSDGTIQLWDVATGQHKDTFAQEPWDSVSALAFSPDGRVLASGHSRGGIRLWNYKTGASMQTLGHSSGHPFSLVFSADGKTVASCSWDHKIKLWDTATGHHKETLVGNVGKVTSLAYSQSLHSQAAKASARETLASLSEDGTVLLWDIIPSVATNAIVRIAPSPAWPPAIGKHLTLNFDVSGEENVTGYQTVLEFDATTLRYISSQNGDYLLGEATFVSELVNPNRLRVIAAASASSHHTEGTLATVTFEVLAAKASTVQLSHVRLIRSDGKGARPIPVSGSVLEPPRTGDVATDSTRFALPEGATGRIGKGTINAIKLSPDKTLLAVAGSAGVWLYDANTGAELALLNGHTAPVSSIAFSPYGDILVSGSYDGKICLWNPQTHQLLRTLKDGGRVASVTFSPDGRTLANASGETIRLWDVQTGDSKASFGNHTSSLSSVIFSPDGRTLASEDTDGNVALWDAQTGVHKAAIDTERGYSTSMQFRPGGYALAFSPDGSLLSSTLKTTIQLLDANTGEKKVTLEGHTDFILTAAFSADGATLVSASRDQTIRVWDTRTGENIAKRVGFLLTLPVQRYLWQPHRLRMVEFLSDGELFASADSRRGEIRLADTSTGEVRLMLTGYTNPITSIAFSPDGTILARVGSDRETSIQLGDVQTGQHAATFIGEEPAFRDVLASFSSVSFSPDGETLAGKSSDNRTIFLWDVQTQQLKGTLAGDWGYPGTPMGFSPDGQTLASGAVGTVRLWDVQTGQPKVTLWGHDHAEPIRSLVFSPDGELLASSAETIRLWDAKTGTLGATFGEYADSLAFSPDGATLASSGVTFVQGRYVTTVQLWNVATGKHKTTFNLLRSNEDKYSSNYPDRGSVIDFSPDGSTLAIAGSRSSIQLWDAKIGEYRRTLRGHTAPVTFLAFSPDGRTLASGSWDGTILLWEMASLPLTRIHITQRLKEAPPIGERFQLSIHVADGRNVSGYQFTVNFDAAALRYSSSRNGDYLLGEVSAAQPVINQNSVVLAAHSAAGASSGNGELATIYFEVTARTASPLTLSDVVLTDSEGKQSFPLTGRGWLGEPAPLPGDVNNDRQVDTQDLEVVASRLGQPGYGNRADVNEDGVVDIADLVWITSKIQSASSSTD